MAEIAGNASANQLCDQSPLLPPPPRVHHHRGQFQAQASVTSVSSGGGIGSSSCSAAAAGERPLKIGVLGTKGVGKTGTRPADLLMKIITPFIIRLW